MMTKKEYAAADIFKMICAILVMLIHTKPFESLFWIDAGVGMITRFAVPYFFTISSFFLHRKIQRNKEKKWNIIGGYLLRLLRFYIIWFVIIRLFYALILKESHGFKYYIKQFFFTTDGSILWFINALIWATIIVSLLGKFINKIIIFIISCFVLLIGYYCSTLLGVTQGTDFYNMLKPFVEYVGVQGGLFFAFPYVAMGGLLAEKDIIEHYKRDFLLVILFFVFMCAESFIAVTKLSAPFTFLWLFALPMTYFVTRLTLSIEMESKSIFYVIRKITTLFYAFHFIVLKCLQILSQKYIYLFDKYNIVLTVVTLIITLLCSLLFFGLVNNRTVSKSTKLIVA